MKNSFAASLVFLVSLATAQQGAPIGYAAQNGGTTGGKGGTTVTVASLDELTAAVGRRTDTTAKIIYIKGAITGSAKVYIGSNKSIVGLDSGASLTGVGLHIDNSKNVIVQNLKISKVLASNGDAIGIQASTNVWVDHVDVSSDIEHGKDYYDGLIDVSHASDWVTVSNSYIHDHYKASLVGHSDSNGAQDKGYLHVTYANNHWNNISSRTPSVRFGTAHIFNSYYSGVFTNGIDTREGAQVLVESTVFAKTAEVIGFFDGKVTGYAIAKDVSLGSGNNTAPKGNLTSVPYSYTKLGSASVKASVLANAGNKLTIKA
ncbi:Pectate lyase [Ascochyta rabiei]|uniref:pectate lyase n=1 Tax=Didymella rabiei TaxID=5454 RepID=A0A162ZT86_DIDRA|nr:Pectate lyase [Ascochyta rabiei]KZM20792.1 lyase [Ascochyta rabiei]UPX20631.1 Pectate lyase [Ascochyta rabiei]